MDKDEKVDKHEEDNKEEEEDMDKKEIFLQKFLKWPNIPACQILWG